MRIEKSGKSKGRDLLARFHVWWSKGYGYNEASIEELILKYDASKAGLFELSSILLLLMLILFGGMTGAAFLCKRETDFLIGTSIVIFSFFSLYWVLTNNGYYDFLDSTDDPQIETKSLMSDEAILEHPQETDNQEQNILEQVKSKAEKSVQISKEPNRKNLDALKTLLGIKKGSLQFKKRGSGTYLVLYNPYRKGYDWIMIGKWTVLQHLIEAF